MTEAQRLAQELGLAPEEAERLAARMAEYAPEEAEAPAWAVAPQGGEAGLSPGSARRRAEDGPELPAQPEPEETPADAAARAGAAAADETELAELLRRVARLRPDVAQWGEDVY